MHEKYTFLIQKYVLRTTIWPFYYNYSIFYLLFLKICYNMAIMDILYHNLFLVAGIISDKSASKI